MPRNRAVRLPILGVAVAALLTAAVISGCRTSGVSGNSQQDPTLTSVIAPVETAELSKLPDGPAKSLVTERCLLCHGAGLITQQQKDAAAWGRTVTQMRTWGSPIQDDDQTAIVAYLTQHYGPNSARR